LLLPIFNLNRNVRKKNLTVFGRWGFLFLIFLITAGCSSSSTREACVDPELLTYGAAVDSLGIEAFVALSPEEQKSRRKESEKWMDRFSSEKYPTARIQALRNAVGLAPDDPSIWLQQAHLWRWLGNYLKTVECLDSAAAAVRNYNPRIHSWSKREMQRRTALARAWLHYDRGEWQLGLDWARAARQVAPTDASVRQIYGLLAGHTGLRSEAEGVADDLGRVDAAYPDINWIKASYRISTGQYAQAFNLIMDLHPNRTHQAECWREMGEIAEYLGEYAYASRWYTESFYSLPFRDLNCLSTWNQARLKPGSQKTWQKVWLAFDRYYVTGSYSAYTNLALQRFQKNEIKQEKDFWAGQVVNSAGILLRKDIDKPWAYRARGLVFAYMGKQDRGIRDLKQASVLLGGKDYRVEAILGHLYLEKNNHKLALNHLKVAADLDPWDATVWRDTGLALIMADKLEEAKKALTRALELDPESATSWYNRGLLYLHRKDYGKAVYDLDKAAALAPENEEVIKLLQQARVLERQKR